MHAIPSDLFQEIIAIQNIELAYLELVAKLDEESKSRTYFGIDGMYLDDMNFEIAEILRQIQSELITFKALTPSLTIDIPKKNGGTREIYIYTVIDRIKAQAIYRVVEPYFEKIYSDNLYSYRSSHPYERALRSVVKRYRNNIGHEWIVVGDVKDYTYNVNKKRLIQKLYDVGFPDEVVQALKLYIDNWTLQKSNMLILDKGVMVGISLVNIFLNFYLTDFDREISKMTSFYRRVGDDFLIFDTPETCEKVRAYILKKIGEEELQPEKLKILCMPNTEVFSYVGYTFCNGKIQIKAKSAEKILERYKSKLHPIQGSQRKKTALLYKIFFDPGGLFDDMISLLRLYKYTNDTDQISKISQQIWRYVTRFMTGKSSFRDQNLCKNMLKNIPIPSFANLFFTMHYGHASIHQIALSKKTTQ